MRIGSIRHGIRPIEIEIESIWEGIRPICVAIDPIGKPTTMLRNRNIAIGESTAATTFQEALLRQRRAAINFASRLKKLASHT